MLIQARLLCLKKYHLPFICLCAKQKRIRAYLQCLLASLLILSATTFAQTQAVNKQRITASYIYNFAKNIEWPNEAGMASFDIAVFSAEKTPVYNELELLAEKVKLKNLPITISQVSAAKSLGKFQLIYIENASNQMVTDIYSAVEGKPVLLVTFDFTNKQLVMINLVPATNERLRFEVNKSNLINQGLKPLPELILNGGSEIDVAKLFREGQTSLVNLQKQLQSREKALADLSANIQSQEALNARLEKQMIDLNKNIQKSDALIATQNEQLEKGKKERLDLVSEVERRTQELNAQQQELKTIVTEITAREKRVAELDATIKNQELALRTQKDAIASLDEIVGAQKRALMYSWGLVVLGVALVITIWLAYAVKRRDNQRLAARAQDLQFAKDRLAIAKRKAEDASQAKGEFLSLMSHELRTPLQAIIGYTEVVIEDLKLNDDQIHVKDLTRVINNSERLLKLINGVLDLAKIESGRMQLDLTEVKLSSLVDDAVGTVKPLLEKNNIHLKLDVNDGAFLPLADPEKLLHMMINLLGNASKFSPNGVVNMRAHHEPHRIYITVSDTGIGMSVEQQQHIFDPFRQADSSTTRKFQGSGLGLSITRQLCEMMGGTIEVESQLGAGATFIVDVPLPIEPDSSFGASGVSNDWDIEDTQQNPDVVGNHIVMIDDDPAFLDIMARTMRHEGYFVHTAHDAETGFTLLQKVKPQVITLDLLLPDQHGWLLFEKIKADPELKDVPVIIISIMDDRKYSYKRQAEEYLTKPIRRETLKLAVQRLAPNKD
jgi:signal transduction histidine kinase/ActR/RegA family two-component response regulator